MRAWRLRYAQRHWPGEPLGCWPRSWSWPSSSRLNRPWRKVDLNLPQPSVDDPVTVEADQASHWTQGAYEVWHLQGSCMISQGLIYARAAEGIIWVERGGLNGDPPNKVIAYLEGKVTIDYQTGTDGIIQKDKGAAGQNQRENLARTVFDFGADQDQTKGRTRTSREAGDL